IKRLRAAAHDRERLVSGCAERIEEGVVKARVAGAAAPVDGPGAAAGGGGVAAEESDVGAAQRLAGLHVAHDAGPDRATRIRQHDAASLGDRGDENAVLELREVRSDGDA